MRFLIADSQPLFREALSSRLLQWYPHSTIHQADQIDGLLRSLDNGIQYDLVVLDAYLDGRDTAKALFVLLQKISPLNLLLIIPHRLDSTMLDLAHSLSCSTFTRLEDASQLDSAVKLALAKPLQKPVLTTNYLPSESIDPRDQLIESFPPQRLAVLRQVLRGHTNKHIAERLNIVEATVKSHVSSIMKQLNVRNRTQILVVLKDYEFV